MEASTLLEDKRAVVFGAGGSIGAAVAQRFASVGARLFLAGRSESSLAAITQQINDSGGQATYAVVDALDDVAVGNYLDEVVETAGGIDVELNAIGPRAAEYGTGCPSVDLPVEQFLAGLTVLTSQWITGRCAARRMISQGSGVVIFLTGSPARPHTSGATAIGAAFAGIENVMRTMALELAGTGVRVVCLRTAANPDSRTIQDVSDTIARMSHTTREAALTSLAESTFLRVSPHVVDTANGAVLLASDFANMMTGTVHNATAGACPD
jgi:3-oxoacyl-[acyl-carrier protein] reductase